MNDRPASPEPTQHISAASEERFIASTEEFASERSRATVLATYILQTLLVGCVVLWVLDVPRNLLNVSFYTEQLLAVTLGLTLALAFVTESSRQPSAIDLGGLCGVGAVIAYLLYHYYAQGEISWPMVGALAVGIAWTATASRAAYSRWFDWLCAVVSLLLCAYITVRYEALTYELAMLPLEGVIGSAILTFLVLDASRRISGWGFVAIIIGDRGLRLHQPVHGGRLPDPMGVAGAHGRLRRPRRERHDRLDPAGRRHRRHPLHHPRPGAGAHRRRGFLLRSRDVGDVAVPRRRRQDRGGRLGAVRHDLGQRGVERARRRHRHHPGDEEIRLLRLQGRGDRIGRLDRRPVDAAGDGRRRLHHGGVPAGLLRRGLHRRRHSRRALLRLPVHPRRSRRRQAGHRRRRRREHAVADRSAEIGLALRRADRFPGHRADLSGGAAADAREGGGRGDRHPDRVRADLRLPRQARHDQGGRRRGDGIRPRLARHHPDRRRRRHHGRDHEHLRPRLRHDDAAAGAVRRQRVPAAALDRSARLRARHRAADGERLHPHRDAARRRRWSSSASRRWPPTCSSCTTACCR